MHFSKESIKMTEMWLWCKILNFIIDADEIVFWAWIIKMGFCKIVTLCSARQQLKLWGSRRKGKRGFTLWISEKFPKLQRWKTSKKIRDLVLKKTAVLLDFVQMRGGKGPAQFFVTFSRGAFFVSKGAYFFQIIWT